MLKVLIILILVGYVFFKASAFVLNVLFGGLKGGSTYRSNRQTQDNSNTNVNIEIKKKRGQRNSNDFKGGEYVDYEEVD